MPCYAMPCHACPCRRLADPWPELAAYVDSLDLATAEDHVHSHIPYGALCSLADNAWRLPGWGLRRACVEPRTTHAMLATEHAQLHGCTLRSCPHRLLFQPAAPPPLPLLPPAVLLAKAAKQWQAEHGGALPCSTAERSAFKELIKGWQRDIDGIPLEVGLCCVMLAEMGVGMAPAGGRV